MSSSMLVPKVCPIPQYNGRVRGELAGAERLEQCSLSPENPPHVPPRQAAVPLLCRQAAASRTQDDSTSQREVARLVTPQIGLPQQHPPTIFRYRQAARLRP
jgi:hypothetical protein